MTSTQSKTKTQVPQAVAYTRLSLDKDGTQLGVARQLTEITQHANAQGVTIARVFSDNSKSAYSGKTRPAYEELRAAIRAGQVSSVWVWDTSRLYRRLRDLIDLIPELEEANVTVQSVRGGLIDLSTASGRFQAQIMASVNEHESSIKAERQQARNRQRLTEERRPASMSIVPFGYQRTNVKGVIAPDPKEAPAVVFCFESVVKGYSLARISRELVEQGFTGRHGAALTYARISAIVRNPRYAGYLVSKGEILGDSAEEALITRELWQQTQAVLNDPSRKPTRGRPAVALMTRLNILKCEYCDKNMTPAVGGRHAGNLYRCQNGCASRSRDLVDRVIFDAVVAFVMEHSEEIAASAEPNDTVSAAVIQLEQYESRLSALTDLFVSGGVDAVSYAEASKRLRDAIGALAVPEQAPRLSVALGGPQEAAEAPDALYGRLIDLPLESKRALVKELVAEVRVRKGRTLTESLELKFKSF